MSKKQRKRGARKGKAYDEKKLPWVEMKGPEAQAYKEELIGQFLNFKLEKEEAMVKSNLYTMNYEWRTVLRKIKSEDLKQEIEVLRQIFDRTLDMKDSSLQSIIKDLIEAEGQYLMAKRNHLFNIDKFIDLHKNRIQNLQNEFEEQKDDLVKEFGNEKNALLEHHKEEILKLQNMIYALEETSSEKDLEGQSEFQGNMDEIKNKNLEEVHTLRLRQVNLLESLWNGFKNNLKNYHDATDEKKKSFEELKAKDDANGKIIMEQMEKIQLLKGNISKSMNKTTDNKLIWNAKDKEILDEKVLLSEAINSIKKSWKAYLENKEQKLASIINDYRQTQFKMNNVITKGEKLLVTAEKNRRLESEKEKVIPFKDHRDKDSIIFCVTDIKDPSIQYLTKESEKYECLEKFWSKYNKVIMENSSLELDIEDLKKKKTELTEMLNNFLNIKQGGSFNPQILNPNDSSQNISQNSSSLRPREFNRSNYQTQLNLNSKRLIYIPVINYNDEYLKNLYSNNKKDPKITKLPSLIHHNTFQNFF